MMQQHRNVIDDAGDLECAGDFDGFASRRGFEEGPDLGIVLHGADGGVAEGELR